MARVYSLIGKAFVTLSITLCSGLAMSQAYLSRRPRFIHNSLILLD